MFELASLLAHHAKYRTDSMAVVCEGQRFTYDEFWQRVSKTAGLFQQLGLKPGDKVATISHNSLNLLEIYWAAPSYGLCLTPLSPLLMAHELIPLLKDAQPECLVIQAQLLPLLESLKDSLPEHIIVIDGPAAGHLSYEALHQDAVAITPRTVHPDTPYNIMFTSGTTGEPKGIVHTHFMRSMYAALIGSVIRMTPESRILQTGSIVFNGAFVTLMPAFYLGCCYFLQDKFDAEQAIRCIEQDEITHTMLVPSQIAAILNSPLFDPRRLQSLEAIVSLGAPLLQRDKERLNDYLPGRLYELYGLTEGFLTILDRDDASHKMQSVGIPPHFYQVKVVREDGSHASPGEYGEIAGRGPTVISEYLKQPTQPTTALKDGWIHTGDIGYLDDEGFLYLVDRKNDIIKNAGNNIYPREIEEVAIRHPSIVDVAVFGIQDEQHGEVPAAAVMLDKQADVDRSGLISWINERVPTSFQAIKDLIIVDDMPRNVAGKTLRRALKETYHSNKQERLTATV